MTTTEFYVKADSASQAFETAAEIASTSGMFRAHNDTEGPQSFQLFCTEVRELEIHEMDEDDGKDAKPGDPIFEYTYKFRADSV